MTHSSREKKPGAWRTMAVGLWIVLVLAQPAAAAHMLVVPGEPMPDLEFEELLAAEDYPRLWLPQRSGPFRLSQVPGEVLIVEFFNKSCVPCQRQVRHLEKFYQEMGRSELAGRVRVLAVAAGNQAKYLYKYRESRGLTYPIAADPQFDQWRRLGDPGRTPFSLFLRKKDGLWTLVNSYFGVQLESEFHAHTRFALSGESVPYHPRAGENPEAPHFALPLEAPGIQEAALRLLGRAAGAEVTVQVLALAQGTSVYRAFRQGRPLDLYARLATRGAVCEVCHAVHFLFAFDSGGRVLGFEPIHVTKVGNEEWDPEDNRFFEGRLAGRPMAGLQFDPEMDAVSMATMSSALIFDEVRRSADLVRLLPRP